MGASFEFFDHTADMGIRVRAASQVELVAPSIEGLYAAIGELLPRSKPTYAEFDLRGTDAATLLRDFLTELLLRFERDRAMAVDVTVNEFSDHRLSGAISLCPVDMERSVFSREVKAITYHELEIRRVADGVEATIIVDI